jgi:hypothetical protein
MRLSVEDTRSGKVLKIDVKDHHIIERIIEIVIKHMGFIHSEQRSYALVFGEQELPNSLTIKDAIHKFGLKEFDRLILWTKVVGG